MCVLSVSGMKVERELAPLEIEQYARLIDCHLEGQASNRHGYMAGGRSGQPISLLGFRIGLPLEGKNLRLLRFPQAEMPSEV